LDFFHLLLHRDEPDQFEVQLDEQVIDACFSPFTGKGDSGTRLQRFVPSASPAASGGPCPGGRTGCRAPGGVTGNPPGYSSRNYGRVLAAQARIHHVQILVRPETA
jgi:hypothetical protein